MSEDPLRLTEMSDPPPELIALVRRMDGPPPMPPELPGLLVRSPRPSLRIVGPTLAMVAIAVGAYLVYRMVDAPERLAPVVVRVEAPPPAPVPSPPLPEPVIAAPVAMPPTPPVEERVPTPRPRPAPSPAASHEIADSDPFASGAERAQGRLIIQTMPWAHVFVDGRDTGLTTPARLSVDAGRHTIGLRTEDGVMHDVLVGVGAGETTRIVRQLEIARPQRSRSLGGSDIVRPF